MLLISHCSYVVSCWIEAKAAAPDPVKVDEMKQAVLKSDLQSEDEKSRDGAQGNIQPVGHDYVEEVREFFRGYLITNSIGDGSSVL